MVKVERPPAPESLSLHADEWTQQLLDEIARTGKYSLVPETVKERYRQEDVKEALEAMYNGKCCYCESGIGHSDFPHIEHRKPKADPRFHHLSFAWDNLHWSCTICNNNKRNQWDELHPILDPVIDDPEEHFTFDIENCEAVAMQTPGRGATTIAHTKLNRKELVLARERIKRLLLYYAEINRDNRETFLRLVHKLLVVQTEHGEKAEYSMFIKKMLNDVWGITV